MLIAVVFKEMISVFNFRCAMIISSDARQNGFLHFWGSWEKILRKRMDKKETKH